jgi:hypothetical protein
MVWGTKSELMFGEGEENTPGWVLAGEEGGDGEERKERLGTVF